MYEVEQQSRLLVIKSHSESLKMFSFLTDNLTINIGADSDINP